VAQPPSSLGRARRALRRERRYAVGDALPEFLSVDVLVADALPEFLRVDVLGDLVAVGIEDVGGRGQR
jgi:hypothetical protein